MIKHGQIKEIDSLGSLALKQLSPIRHLITKGVADANEAITVVPKPCDARKAKQFDPQNCLAAKTMSRELPLRGVSVSRSIAYAVWGNGLATRHVLNGPGRNTPDNFDRGWAVLRPIVLGVPPKSCRLGSMKKKVSAKTSRKQKTHKSVRIGTRALDGGVIVH